MRVLAAELARARQADVAAIHAAFDPAVTALAGATAWMVQAQARDPAQAAAVAVPYLMLWGTVAGGWQMARAALIASATIAGKDGRSFHRTKLATARFYAEHVLPQAGALASEVISGAGSVLAVQPEDL
jgi:3-(methylthio)propanoyl-CoA dehydrogenase